MSMSNNQRIQVLFALVILGLFMLIHSSSAALNGNTNQANVSLTNSSDLCKDIVCTSEQYCDSGKCICMTNFTCASSCDNVLCGSDDYCTQGKCVKKGSDLCKDIVCTPEQYCDSGKCICRTNFTCASSCDNVLCGSDDYCTQKCEKKGSDLCKDIVCTSEQYCDSGKCICRTNFTCASSCDNVLCGSDDYCTQGKCVKKGSDLCKDIVCTPEQYCDSGKCICRTNFTCNGASNLYRPLTFILLLCVAILVAM